MSRKIDIKNLFFKALSTIGMQLPDVSFDLLLAHYHLVMKWNSTFNLTSLNEPSGIIDRLYIDSLLFSQNIPHETPAVYDFGSGPGFPGIPLLLSRPELALTIVEPKQKMVSFLSEVKYAFHNQLSFNIEQSRCDSQGFVDANRNGISVAVSKGFAPPDKALPLVQPLLAPDGIYVTCTNEDTEVLIPSGCPLILASEHSYSLPLTGRTTRHLIFRHINSN
jgi:16S rRNA (guanine527-N7)-methyltransferase